MLFIANSVGYFLGSALNDSVGGKAGMPLWGAAYGVFLEQDSARSCISRKPAEPLLELLAGFRPWFVLQPGNRQVAQDRRERQE